MGLIVVFAEEGPKKGVGLINGLLLVGLQLRGTEYAWVTNTRVRVGVLHDCLLICKVAHHSRRQTVLRDLFQFLGSNCNRSSTRMLNPMSLSRAKNDAKSLRGGRMESSSEAEWVMCCGAKNCGAKARLLKYRACRHLPKSNVAKPQSRMPFMTRMT